MLRSTKTHVPMHQFMFQSTPWRSLAAPWCLHGGALGSLGVLLGTDSFWQGVDVPGDALKTVIITKLPFSVPDHPLLEARLEAIRESGGNPFGEYQLPEAVIKFRQGFGRLIRTQTDEGTVVVLDPRVYTKYYGKAFVASLPACEIIEEVVGEV